MKRWYRILIWLAAGLLLLAALTAGGFYFATKALKSKVEAALGPYGEIGEIRVGFSAIEVLNLRIKASSGWPAQEELSAKRVIVEPDLRALLSRNLRISQIRIEEAYISMLRRKDGKLLMLPSLLAGAGESKAKTGQETSSLENMPAVQLGGVSLSNCAVDFFDATVRQPPLKLRLEQVNAQLGTLLLPQLSGRTSIELAGVLKGVHRDGTVNIAGYAELATRESEMAVHMRGVDLVALQPYLIKAAETGVKKGTLDLELKSSVRQNRLYAPGSVTLSNLELATGGTFMGLSQGSVVAALKDKNGRISVKFVLEGNINDPRFSLNENLSARIGASAANYLGISLEGIVRGVGSAGSGASRGLGDTMRKLFGK